jgi:hypothetical protein
MDPDSGVGAVSLLLIPKGPARRHFAADSSAGKNSRAPSTIDASHCQFSGRSMPSLLRSTPNPPSLRQESVEGITPPNMCVSKFRHPGIVPMDGFARRTTTRVYNHRVYNACQNPPPSSGRQARQFLGAWRGEPNPCDHWRKVAPIGWNTKFFSRGFWRISPRLGRGLAARARRKTQGFWQRRYTPCDYLPLSSARQFLSASISSSSSEVAKCPSGHR